MIKLSGWDFESFADADGVSCVLFISGCRHKCPGCHSPQTHDFNYGVDFDDQMIKFINAEISKRPFLNALVLSGGDPMYSAKDLIPMLSKLHIPHQNLWCYSGFTFEEIMADADMSALLRHCNVLVDGMFDISKRDITLKFRGSSNQRLIDVQKSIQNNEVVLWDSELQPK